MFLNLCFEQVLISLPLSHSKINDGVILTSYQDIWIKLINKNLIHDIELNPKQISVLKNGTWNNIKYEGKIEELQVMNISNNAKLPVYATGDSSFQSNMAQQGKDSKQSDTGIKFYEFFNEACEAVDIYFVPENLEIQVLKNGTWNNIKYEGKIEELQVMNISNNAKLPVYATGDSSFQSNMQAQSRPFRQTNTGVKFYELFNEFYESVDIQIVEVIVQIRDVDQFGVSEIYPDKTGGQLITNFQYERSIHDGETRDTYEATGAVLDAETTFILKTNGFSTNDQLSIKRRGGPHNDTHPKAGRCYAIGAGTNGDPHLAKEIPAHPNTPKFKKPIVIEPGMPANIGDLKNKLIGIKAVDYNIENNTKVMLEVWIDLDPLDAAGKPKNNWKKWWHAIDDGNWDDGDGNEEGGPPYLSLQGVTGGETSEKIYLRMDNVTNKAVATMSSCREINPTGVIVEHPCTDPNAHKDPTSGICVCNFGFHMENGVCVKDTSPVCPDENSHWDNALQKCVCNAGFHDVNGVCVPVVYGKCSV